MAGDERKVVSVTSVSGTPRRRFDGFGEAKFLRALAVVFTIRSPDECLP